MNGWTSGCELSAVRVERRSMTGGAGSSIAGRGRLVAVGLRSGRATPGGRRPIDPMPTAWWLDESRRPGKRIEPRWCGRGDDVLPR
jgi:hypothetical protein